MVPQRVAVGTNIFDSLVEVLQTIDARRSNLEGTPFPSAVVDRELQKVRLPIAELVNEMRSVGMSGVRYR